MTTQKNSNRKNKIRIKPIPILILCMMLISMIALLVWTFREKPKKESVNISVSGVEATSKKAEPSEPSTSAQEITVSIDMESCAIPIGTTLKVTASVGQIDVGKTINWSSSDENVFTVNYEGIITMKGKGTSALTATVGSVSASIVIEGISNDDSGISLSNLPKYNLTASGTTKTTATTANNPNNSVSNNDGSNTNINDNNPSDIVNTDNANSTDNSSNNNSNDSGNSNDSDDSNHETSGGLKSTALNESLNEIGYSQILSNVYIYEENDTYYGEIIIQSNVTIIYVKQRCDAYDAKIKEVLSRLLPNENAQVWSNYISASSDRTFTVEGRMVRIVTALNGGHSQIVIYN